MIRYLVCIKSKATDDNPNFAGQELTTYYGKGCCLVASYGSHAEATYTAQEMTVWYVKEYGYTRKCDAVRNWCYRNPENGKYCTSTASIVRLRFKAETFPNMGEGRAGGDCPAPDDGRSRKGRRTWQGIMPIGSRTA